MKSQKQASGLRYEESYSSLDNLRQSCTIPRLLFYSGVLLCSTLHPIRTNFTSKALKLDLRPLLVKSEPIRVFPTWSSILQEDWDPKNDEELTPVEQLAQYLHEDRALDCALLKLAQSILETPVGGQIDPAQANVFYEAKIGNSDRAFGSTLSFAISRQFNVNGLPEGRHIKILLRGSAGQSFCAFLAKGVTVRLEGDANDYVAKGLSGGHVTIVPPRKLLEQGFQTQQNLIVGNVCLYGATEGVLFLRGQAAERFCVRNSGAIVVVEGVGDHGCEYMTGGRAVILGRTGRNFAAGMSGGLAFVYDTDGIQGPFGRKCNRELVDLELMTLENPYSSWLQSIIGEFTMETCSEVSFLGVQ
ncbi:Glutamate synthase [Fasciola gigantica]|uniref:Glutamate synthase n=1 Tax=Fasciola gigantica TaxID=46835 RepID=A0A504YCG1_FASGI|nr:Glutamate synthase [Fasciola gigantica]